MANKNDWMLYGLGVAGIVAAIYWYITNQKAGANNKGIAVGEPNPSAPKEGGCGCGMEPQTHTDAYSSTAVPSTG